MAAHPKHIDCDIEAPIDESVCARRQDHRGVNVLCNQCGTDNPVQNKFCGQCGSRLNAGSGDMTASMPSAVGPVSSEFRREVEQQRIRLQRLEDEPAKRYS